MTIREGQIVDLWRRRIYPGRLTIEGGRIAAITPLDHAPPCHILPGFIDAHVHIESSLLPPSEFGRLAVRHGTVATVSDPHEIANVLGRDGVRFMIDNAAHTPFRVYFGAPSCVPATPFETAGGRLDAAAVAELLASPDIHYLSEMMNVPGVLQQDPEVMAKLAAARAAGKPLDGHAPGLSGEALARYIGAGISTDHESVSLAEGREKLAQGMRLLIREGSAAKDFAALIPLLTDYPEQVMFASDDCHPDDLWRGHIDRLVRRAVALGYPLFAVLQAACLNPIRHYGLDVGSLRPGDAADFIVSDNCVDFTVRETWCRGECLWANGQPRQVRVPVTPINHFAAQPITAEQLKRPAPADPIEIRVIAASDGALLTQAITRLGTVANGLLVAAPEQDLLKLVVLNRYTPDAAPAVAFVQGFGLRCGALASSVAHDSHNIVAVGCDDRSLARAINRVIASRGGLCAIAEDEVRHLALPIAGLMSDAPGEWVAANYEALTRFAKERLGSPLSAPFMTLSFMALLVIPELKLSDRGLFDGRAFGFVPLTA